MQAASTSTFRNQEDCHPRGSSHGDEILDFAPSVSGRGVRLFGNAVIPSVENLCVSVASASSMSENPEFGAPGVNGHKGHWEDTPVLPLLVSFDHKR
jgi:hypothetical protein